MNIVMSEKLSNNLNENLFARKTRSETTVFFEKALKDTWRGGGLADGF